MIDQYILGRLLENAKVEKVNSFQVLNIYFTQKSIEDKQIILADSAFGC